MRTLFSKRALAALAVFFLAYSYFALFRNYGFQLEDEGTLLFQLDRAARGQYPYVDFHTGYTPGFFAVGAALLQALHYQVGEIRTALALLNAATATGLYLVAAPLVGGVLALVSPVAFVLFLPVWPGDFAAFNVPYPAWPATAAWIIVALVMSAWMRRGGYALLAIAGLAAGVAFGIKPNAGAFALAASTWIVAMGARGEGPLDRAAATASSIGMLLGVLFAFAMALASVDALVHLPACLVLTVFAITGGRAALATTNHPRAMPALAALFGGFAIPTLAWALPVLSRLGVDGFIHDVLLIGSGAAELYYLPHPPPELYAVAVTIAVAMIALAGRGIGSRLFSPTLPFVALVGGVLGGATVLHLFSLAPEGFRRSILWQLENAAFWLAPLANWGGVALLLRWVRRGQVDARTRALAVVMPLAAAMYLQLFPRSDFMHLLMGVPLTFIVALALLRRVSAWWSAGNWPEWTRGQHPVGTFVGFVLLAVLAIRFGVNLEPLAHVTVQDDLPRVGIETPRANLWVESRAADDLVALGKASTWLSARVTPGEPVLTFPAAAGVLYLTNTTSPVPHDYWYPGRPDHEDEKRMLATIEHEPPRYVVTLNGAWFFFSHSPAYFMRLGGYVCSNYRLAARFGRFDVLERRDLGNADAAVERWQPTGTLDEVSRSQTGERRQAVWRWLAGLEADATKDAKLPTERVDALLFLRGLRDAGDMRSTAWLMAGYRSTDPRLRNEAIAAMDKVSEAFHASQYRWACDVDFAALKPFVAGSMEEARTLKKEGDPRVHPFADAVLLISGK